MKTRRYAAVVNRPKGLARAGKSVVPGRSPIGFLPGDDVTAQDEPLVMMASGVPCGVAAPVPTLVRIIVGLRYSDPPPPPWLGTVTREILDQEILESDFQAGVRGGEGPAAEPRPLAEAVKIFEQRHSTYRVVVDSTAVVIRPRVQSLPFLDSLSPIREERTVTGPLKSVKTVFAGLYPRLAGGGVELNSMGYPGWDKKVVLKGGKDRTVTDTLNQIAAQMPGYAWLVTTKAVDGRVQVVELSVLESDGNRRYITISENR